MKIRIRLIVFLLSLGVIGISGAAVLHAEQEKRYYRYLSEKNYYSEQYNNWAVYKKEYQEQIAKLTEENKANMAATKDQYDRLLAQQSDIIKQHTRTQLDGTQTTGNTTGATVTSQTTTKTVKVSRPVSKPKTQAS